MKSVLRHRTSSSRGLTRTEVLTTLTIVVAIMALVVPAILRSREEARKVDCKFNLKLIGLALHNYHDSFNVLPSGWIGVDEHGKPHIDGVNGFGWGTFLIPGLEANPIYNNINFVVHIAEPDNKPLRTGSPWLPPGSFRCPGDPGNAVWTTTWKGQPVAMPTGTYVGVFGPKGLDRCAVRPAELCIGSGAFFQNSSLAFKNFRDGLSETCVVGERRSHPNDTQPWQSTWAGVVPGEPRALYRLLATGEHPPNDATENFSGFSSTHPGGAHILYADGSVRFLANETDLAAFQEMLTTGSGKDKVTDF